MKKDSLDIGFINWCKRTFLTDFFFPFVIGKSTKDIHCKKSNKALSDFFGCVTSSKAFV